ncbi:hypothetical protein K493DRAFT_301856 [Basidiobolus meristosporus CBS 931.73]|uniref:Uncharacterized protein n=1 Tax=Basidiobolus meristosporus CBS 931.73 TaxID=1314790 RepID=A0A1Y1YAI2_9FUNG|nr:hypothetical protein K493DRAFT_301856 [Basidiobolus meristosporus CBS 931.73]|eukprot:ORX94766.1 hypothetical protein K493DRAFT_301856 [Basidiobolus meristosporus CBS 931.73]
MMMGKTYLLEFCVIYFTEQDKCCLLGMKFLSVAISVALVTQIIGAPMDECYGWSGVSVEPATDQKATFSSNDLVVLKWTASGSGITNIREVDLFSAKDHQFLHTQYRSYPGISAAEGQLSFILTVPLCLQRDGRYYLEVYSSTAGQDMNCHAQTQVFELTPDPNGNFTGCP